MAAPPAPVRVLIQGAGAVGCWLGARLARAGAEVAFVARGPHLAAMRANGLRLTGAGGDHVVERPIALAEAREAPWTPEICLLAVKAYDVPAAAAGLAEAAAAGAVILTLQNGVAGAEPVLEALPAAARAAARVVPGVAYVSAVIAAPGVVRVAAAMGSVTSAPFPAGAEGVQARFAAAMEAAGVALRFEPDVRLALWRKMIGLATNAAITSLARAPAGVVYRDPDTLAIARRAIAEAGAVARAEGVGLTEADEEEVFAMMRGFPPGMFASMAHDLAAGRRLEAPWLSGTVARLAARHGLDAPVHATAWALLKPHAAGGGPGAPLLPPPAAETAA